MDRFVLLDDFIEELDLSVRAYKVMRAAGHSTVREIVESDTKGVWTACLQSVSSFSEVLTALDDNYYRISDCGYNV